MSSDGPLQVTDWGDNGECKTGAIFNQSMFKNQQATLDIESQGQSPHEQWDHNQAGLHFLSKIVGSNLKWVASYGLDKLKMGLVWS